MGEISDALQRAKDEEERKASPSTQPTNERRSDRDSFPLSLDEVRAGVNQAAAPAPRVDEPPPERRARTETREAPPLPAKREPVVEPERSAKPAAPSGKKKAESRVKISRERDANWRARSVLIPDVNAGEQYRHFAIRLSREIATRQLKSVAIVSGLRQEGKSTTACNLSFAMSSIGGGRRIALVDLDLRRPSVGRYLGLKPRVGIDSVLAGHAVLDEAVVETDVPGLDLYPVAHAMNDAHERIADRRMGEVLRELESRYDLVVVDSPPVLMVPDAAMLAPLVGGCVAVLRARQTHRQAFLRMLEILPSEKMLGIFLNEVRRPTFSRYTAGYYEADEYDPAKSEGDE